MVLYDTSIVIEKVKKREEFHGIISAVTIVEFPAILKYKKFKGDIIFPTPSDFLLACRLQEELMKRGKPKGLADLLVAAICINRREKLITKDKDSWI